MIFASLDFENSLWNEGYKFICGVDEVGRGCFAGPVVAGAVIFSPNSKVPDGIADSKLLTPDKRKNLSVQIKQAALAWAVGVVDVLDINVHGIAEATQMAFIKAVNSLKMVPDFYLIDAFYIKALKKAEQKPIINGDKLSVSIAAASIVAKVYRDELMDLLHLSFPNYGFCQHKGYGTKKHREAIFKYGLSELHRTSFNLAKYLPKH